MELICDIIREISRHDNIVPMAIDTDTIARGDPSPGLSPQSVIMVNTGLVRSIGRLPKQNGIGRHDASKGDNELPDSRQLRRRDYIADPDGGTRHNKMVMQRSVSASRTLPNAYTPASFALDESSSSISRAAFAAAEPLVDSRPSSPLPPRLGFDLIRRAEEEKEADEPLGSIENILRG